MEVHNDKFGGDPCPKTPKYLEVKYECTSNETSKFDFGFHVCV